MNPHGYEKVLDFFKRDDRYDASRRRSAEDAVVGRTRKRRRRAQEGFPRAQDQGPADQESDSSGLSDASLVKERPTLVAGNSSSVAKVEPGSISATSGDSGAGYAIENANVESQTKATAGKNSPL